MRRTVTTRATLALSLTLAALAAGCSEPEATETAPKLPQQFCWNAFDRDNVQPLLPNGEEIKQEAGEFQFSERVRYKSCTLYVDGNYGFRAFATFEDEEGSIDWSSWDALGPDKVPVGRKGIAWNTGAATYVACKPVTGTGPSSAEFMELRIHLSGARGQNERKTLPGLLKQFTAFAQKELKCA
ncbi:hypothetical protein [Streptomyces microflavus]|uniref:hypothetical protein n=1 Tax=Streptomyces microflavus TaxID=1919 RepID=UPI00340DE50B